MTCTTPATRARGRDLVMLVGVEPQLHWKAFPGNLLDLAKSLDVSLILSLGGLLADVPHTVSPRLTGSATQPEVQRRLFGLDVHTSSYEGPTGINGVIGIAARERGIPTASIWGNVPHYISATGNPTITGAILRRLAILLELDLNLAELERQGAAFNAQVSEAIAKNPEVADYVRGLEAKEGVGRVEPVLRRRSRASRRTSEQRITDPGPGRLLQEAAADRGTRDPSVLTWDRQVPVRLGARWPARPTREPTRWPPSRITASARDTGLGRVANSRS